MIKQLLNWLNKEEKKEQNLADEFAAIETRM